MSCRPVAGFAAASDVEPAVPLSAVAPQALRASAAVTPDTEEGGGELASLRPLSLWEDWSEMIVASVWAVRRSCVSREG